MALTQLAAIEAWEARIARDRPFMQASVAKVAGGGA